MNRWAAGEANPFATADWSAAWRTAVVSNDEWTRLRAVLRDQAEQWIEALQQLDAVVNVPASVHCPPSSVLCPPSL